MVPGSVPANGLLLLIEDPTLKNVGYLTITMREADRTAPLYNWAIDTNYLTEIVSQEFRVPVGTVVQSFHID